MVADRLGEQVVTRSGGPDALQGVCGLGRHDRDSRRGARRRSRARCRSAEPHRGRPEGADGIHRWWACLRCDRGRLPGATGRTCGSGPAALGRFGGTSDRRRRKRLGIDRRHRRHLAGRRGGGGRSGAAGSGAARGRGADRSRGSGRIPVASAAVLAMALPAGTPLPPQSGVLVASGERLHSRRSRCPPENGGARGEAELLRLSFGRFSDAERNPARSVSNAVLHEWALEDLGTVFGINADPIDVLVHRWIDALPQYGPGHAAIAADIRAGLPPAWPSPVTTSTESGAGLSGRRRRGRRRCGRNHRPLGPALRGTIGAMAKLDFDALNATIRYVMFSAFAVRPGVLGYDEESRAAVIDRDRYLPQTAGRGGVVVRGIYDVAGMRADADFMIWTHAEQVESLQRLYSDFRRTTALGRASNPTWSSVALHRPAEFNKSHIPAFLAGEEPGNYVCVYPFVRSLDWYLLPDEERRKMLADHGMAARGTRTSARTPSRPSRWATTSGSWLSRLLSCTGSST